MISVAMALSGVERAHWEEVREFKELLHRSTRLFDTAPQENRSNVSGAQFAYRSGSLSNIHVILASALEEYCEEKMKKAGSSVTNVQNSGSASEKPPQIKSQWPKIPYSTVCAPKEPKPAAPRDILDLAANLKGNGNFMTPSQVPLPSEYKLSKSLSSPYYKCVCQCKDCENLVQK